MGGLYRRSLAKSEKKGTYILTPSFSFLFFSLADSLSTFWFTFQPVTLGGWLRSSELGATRQSQKAPPSALLAATRRFTLKFTVAIFSLVGKITRHSTAVPAQAAWGQLCSYHAA